MAINFTSPTLKSISSTDFRDTAQDKPLPDFTYRHLLSTSKQPQTYPYPFYQKMSSNRNSVAAPCPHHPSRTIESLAAGTLFQLYYQDHQNSSANPIPLTSSQIDIKGRLCLSYVFQVSAHLSHEHFNRFLNVLRAYKKQNSFEITRHELSTIFELANEYVLWDELLDLVFPAWTKALEASEQARLRRMQQQGKGLPI